VQKIFLVLILSESTTLRIMCHDAFRITMKNASFIFVVLS